METNDLIQLGELLPMKNAIMSILLPLQAGATISAAIAGSQLLPTVAEQDGEQLLMLGLSGTRLRPNTLIMGQIKIKEGTQQRSLWVSGRVLSQDPTPFQNDVICLRYRDSDLKFFCGSSMALSGERLALLVPNMQQ